MAKPYSLTFSWLGAAVIGVLVLPMMFAHGHS